MRRPIGPSVFAARHEVMLQLMRLATQCRDSWVRRMRAPARMQPPLGECFLMDYYPCPRGRATPPAVCLAAPAGAAQERERPARGPAAQLPAGRGQWHSGRALLGAWCTIVPWGPTTPDPQNAPGLTS